MALVVSCTTVEQNYPDGACKAGVITCVGNNVAKCKDDGSGYQLQKTCAADSPCAGTPPDCKVAPPMVVACQNDGECLGQLTDIGPCREAYCDVGVCRSRVAIEGTTCTDGSACTTEDACKSGICIGTPMTCDDANPCTKDHCKDGVCGATPDDLAACSDAQACTKDDRCVAGTCKGTLLGCDDKNPCTDDFCDTAKGDCAHLAKSGTCDDGEGCTSNDQCVAGACQGTPSCPCATTKDCAQYDPNDPCKGHYVCLDEICKVDPASKFQCPSTGLGACETTQCVFENGSPACKVVAIENGTACSDGSDCTNDDLCVQGECVGTLDAAKPGCATFRVQSFELVPATQTGSPSGMKLRTRFGTPTIVGTAKNSSYRIQAVPLVK